MEFGIGYEVDKENLDDYGYADMAVWCNANGAVITETDNGFRIDAQPGLSDAEMAAIRIRELEEYLASTDYMVIKCMERGFRMEDEYPEDYVKRQEAREEIERLRESLE